VYAGRVEEGDAQIKALVDDCGGSCCVRAFTKVVAAKPNHGHLQARIAEVAMFLISSHIEPAVAVAAG
jgi:hypothetical protein